MIPCSPFCINTLLSQVLSGRHVFYYRQPSNPESQLTSSNKLYTSDTSTGTRSYHQPQCQPYSHYCLGQYHYKTQESCAFKNSFISSYNMMCATTKTYTHFAIMKVRHIIGYMWGAESKNGIDFAWVNLVWEYSIATLSADSSQVSCLNCHLGWLRCTPKTRTSRKKQMPFLRSAPQITQE